MYGLLGRGEEELLVVDTSQPPKAKLVTQRASNPAGASEKIANEAVGGYEEGEERIAESLPPALPADPHLSRRNDN